MKYTDYVALSDYTDEKEYELVVRVFRDEFSFGWYRSANSGKVISDSQFDVGMIDPNEAEDIIESKFNCYYVGRDS